jgi:hypothetical protein
MFSYFSERRRLTSVILGRKVVKVVEPQFIPLPHKCDQVSKRIRVGCILEIEKRRSCDLIKTVNDLSVKR